MLVEDTITNNMYLLKNVWLLNYALGIPAPVQFLVTFSRNSSSSLFIYHLPSLYLARSENGLGDMVVMGKDWLIKSIAEPSVETNNSCLTRENV